MPRPAKLSPLQQFHQNDRDDARRLWQEPAANAQPVPQASPPKSKPPRTPRRR